MTNLTFKLFGAIVVMVAIYIMLYINAEKKKNTVRFMTDFADSLKTIKDYISSSPRSRALFPDARSRRRTGGWSGRTRTFRCARH